MRPKALTGACDMFTWALNQNIQVVALLTFWLFSAQAFGQETRIETVAGEIKITRSETSECNVVLSSKVIAKFSCEYSYMPKIISDLRGKFGSIEEVLILQEKPTGTACNGGPLHLIGLRKNKTFQLFRPLDFCGGVAPIIVSKGKTIRITFPGGPPNIGTDRIPTEVWALKNGQLKKEK